MNRLLLVALIAVFCGVSHAAISNCKTANTADATKCDECNSGFGLATDKSSCVACTVDKCAECAGATPGTCTGCNDGYGLKGTGATATCAACKDANCASCADDSESCMTCKDGYAEDDKGACTACENGCKTCATVDASCTDCPTGRNLNKTDTNDQFCCPVNCTECSGPANCTTCNTGLKLNKDKGTCFGFKTGASLILGSVISVALFSLLF